MQFHMLLYKFAISRPLNRIGLRNQQFFLLRFLQKKRIILQPHERFPSRLISTTKFKLNSCLSGEIPMHFVYFRDICLEAPAFPAENATRACRPLLLQEEFYYYAFTGSLCPTHVNLLVTYSGLVNDALPEGFPPDT